MVILDQKQRKKIAFHRYAILSPLILGTYEDSTKNFFIAATSRSDPMKTSMERLLFIVGILLRDGISTTKRKDCFLNNIQIPIKHRKIDDDIADQIVYLKQEYPRLPATLIKQKLLNNGSIKEDEISLSTINWFINERFHSNENTKNRDMSQKQK